MVLCSEKRRTVLNNTTYFLEHRRYTHHTTDETPHLMFQN